MQPFSCPTGDNVPQYFIDFKSTPRHRLCLASHISAAEQPRLKVPSKEEPVTTEKLLMKGNSVVDPESGLQDTHHILESRKRTAIYSSVLAATDVASNRNSFYKIQVLEGDWVNHAENRKKHAGKGSAAYYIFRSWGRIGTSIGGSLLERCENRDEAVDRFLQLFAEKTGNEFMAQPFVKKPKMMYPMEIDVIPQEVTERIISSRIAPGSRTSLPEAVQQLIQLIFDVDTMKRALLEFEIDANRMPLGQISKNQLKRGYSILCDLQAIIDGQCSNALKVHDLSNQFYTLIPHIIGPGNSKLALLDNSHIIKEKLDMLEVLKNLEIASSIIQRDQELGAASNDDPLDIHYRSLKTDISPVDPTSVT